MACVATNSPNDGAKAFEAVVTESWIAGVFGDFIHHPYQFTQDKLSVRSYRLTTDNQNSHYTLHKILVFCNLLWSFPLGYKTEEVAQNIFCERAYLFGLE